MTTDVAAILERRRFRRRITLWRLIAAVLAIVLVVAIGNRNGGVTDIVGGQQIARVKISGLITEDRKKLELLEKIAKSSEVAAVILAVNSPGGTTTGGEALFEAIRNVASSKPVVASFGTMATSAAYIVGLASDQIVARGNTITGSVGVIFQWAEVHGLLEKIGVKMNEVKSGRLKATPSMFAPLDEEGRSLAQEMVMESQDWFLALVKERRKIEPRSVPGLAQGRIFSGRQALSYKLIDAIGGEEVAIEWLEKKRGIEPNLKVRDWEPETQKMFGLFFRAIALAFDTIPVLGKLPLELFSRLSAFERLKLDGLVSVWHPARH